MFREEELQEQIRAAYARIQGYQQVLRDSTDAEERVRAGRGILAQWALIQEWLDELLTFGEFVPDDICHIAGQLQESASPYEAFTGPSLPLPPISELMGRDDHHDERAEPGAKGPEGAEPPQRVVSTGFAADSAPATPIDTGMPLTCNQPYYFWLEVGKPVAGSMEETPTELPHELPPEARLKVVLFSFPGELELTPGADAGELQLHPDGTVTAARQPAPLPEIPPGSRLHPERCLFFPVRAPATEGTLRLRCNIYFRQVLVQSRVIHARAMWEPYPIEQALRSVLDYNLSRLLDTPFMAGVAEHRLSIVVNGGGDGSHEFRFFGAQNGQEVKRDTSLDGQMLQDLIQQARGALRLAAWDDEQPWIDQDFQYTAPLNLNKKKDRDKLTADLVRMAVRGYRFYFSVSTKLAGGGLPQVEELAALMREPGFVQVALRESARMVPPVALFYDYTAFDTNAAASLCDSFLDAVHDGVPLEEHECFKGNCPNREKSDVVCPSGFWGYRHNIGLPLSATADAAQEILYQEAPELTVCVSTDPAFKLRSEHEQALQAMEPKPDCWHYADTRQEAFDLLQGTTPHLVYFYCHGGVGGTSGDIPFLEVGPPGETGITPDNLLHARVYWERPRPFVFINGCHTTALEPEIALDFVNAFVNLSNASGVMGTEITIFEQLARDFAEDCLGRFLTGTTIGEAVRLARLALLKKGSPLGLVYIPFVLANLQLKKQ